MIRLQTALFLVGCLFLLTAFAEDSGSPDATGGGGAAAGGGQDNTPVAAPAPPAAPIILPGAYGNSAIVVTPGQGRFAKPPYSFTFSLQQGFDTNTYTSSTNAIASAVTNLQLSYEMQSANPRTVYTVDAQFGLMDYWNRPGSNPLDYSGNLSILLFHRFSPRLNISGVINASYLTQPNFAAQNSPVSTTSGNYILLNDRINLSYLWTSRIQTNTSYSLASTLYQEQKSQRGDLYDSTLGNEFRFLLTPRTTFVIEGRANSTTYPNQPGGDSMSYFLLMGGDYSFSSRLNSTLRLGDEIREFNIGGSQSSPYGEFTSTYIYGHQSTLSWNNRFGMDDSSQQTQKITSFRTGLSLNHVLTAKITGILGLNYNRTDTTTGSQTVIAPNIDPSSPFYGYLFPQTFPGVTQIQNQFSGNVGLRFNVNQRISLNINYTLTQVTGMPASVNYFRQQIFLGGSYTF